jgi:prevent-host-death family protein
MKSTYTITEAQAGLPGLVREADDGGAIAITRHGATVAYVVSKRRLDGMLESLELLGNADAMRAIEADRKGRTAFKPLKVLDA